MQSPPGCHGGHGIARAFGSPLLGLKQVDVAATRHVKGVPFRTEQSPLLARKRQVASVDGAQEHQNDCSGAESGNKCAKVPTMPPTKTKLRRDFDSALAAYLEAIDEKKTALVTVTNQPSKDGNKKYESASEKEKEARKVYRRATKKLHALTKNAK